MTAVAAPEPVAEPRASPAPAESRPAPTSPITFEEFLAWADEDTRAEWVNGEVVVMAPYTGNHVKIRDFLVETVVQYVRWKQLGWAAGGFLMRTEARPSGREPDLVFVSNERAGIIGETYLSGPADLAVEVVSPDSVVRDRGDKFEEYEAGGVREYWLIDPLRDEALFYQLAGDGHYRAVAIDAEGFYHSAALPGFRLRVSWLWQQKPPEPQLALLLIGGEDYASYLLDLMRQQLGDDRLKQLR
jgi:Uma2 family endonuclease